MLNRSFYLSVSSEQRTANCFMASFSLTLFPRRSYNSFSSASCVLSTRIRPDLNRPVVRVPDLRLLPWRCVAKGVAFGGLGVERRLRLGDGDRE